MALGGGAGGSRSRLTWALSQCFGEKDPEEEFSDADILSTVEFDSTGRFLATGDKGGRIVVFEGTEVGKVRA
jgi:serine/threonine-protein phosphatase 2A regulatory subunit B